MLILDENIEIYDRYVRNSNIKKEKLSSDVEEWKSRIRNNK